ncbi:hypothetical protein OAK75_12570 [Bacteriovoracales bacterium]|nr:hypothetical protein [Bacteriovoracales bacterium]
MSSKRPLFFGLILFLISSCGEVKRELVSFTMSFNNNETVQSYGGGVFLYAKNTTGLEIKEKLDYPFEHGFSEGDWSFYVISYDGQNLFEGNARCGFTSNVVLNEETLNEETEVNISLNQSNCNSSDAQALITMLCQYFNTTPDDSNSCSNIATPLTVGSLDFWLDSKDSATLLSDNGCTTASGTSNGSAVNCWKNKVGNGSLNAVAVGSPTLDTSTNSEGHVISLTESTYLSVENYNPDYTTGMELFLVFKFSDGHGSAIDLRPDQNYQSVLVDNYTNGLVIMNGSTYYGIGSSDLTSLGQSSNSPFGERGANNSFVIMGITFNGNGNNFSIRKNGDDVIRFTSSTGYSIPSATYVAAEGKLLIGKRGIANQYANGLYGELLIFDEPLSNSERQKVEGYLACRWGLQPQLPSGHPYQSNCP